MNTAARISFVLKFVIRELLFAVLRQLWLTDVRAFEALLDKTDCYPFRVCYELGERRQMWIEDPQDIDAAMSRMDEWEESFA